MSELEEIPEEELGVQEEEILRGIPSGFSIMEKGFEHCVCDEEGEIVDCYDSNSPDIGKLIGKVAEHRANN